MIPSITAAISAQITAVRQAHGSTRDDVAAAAQAAGAPGTFTAAALRNLETGRRAASVDELLWLAAALEVPVRQLLGEHACLFGQDPRAAAYGPVEQATRQGVEELGELSGRQDALAELAYALAGELDGQGERRQPAQLAKALTDAMDRLWDLRPVQIEEDDGLGAQ